VVPPTENIYLVCNGLVSESNNYGSPKTDNQFSLEIAVWSDEFFIINLKSFGDSYEFQGYEFADDSFFEKDLSPTRFYITKVRAVRVDWLEKDYPNQYHGAVSEKIEIDRRSGRATFEVNTNSNIMGINTKKTGSGYCSRASQTPKF